MKIDSIISIIIQNIKIWLYKLSGRSEKIIPYKILINLTNNCNSRCNFCNIWKINKENPNLVKKEINITQITKLFKEINKNLLWLSLSGGEVTLVPYYKDLILAAKRYCPKLKILTFTTNALLPQRALEYALFAQKQGLDVFIIISLDGSRELHNKLRGVPGNYQKAWETYHLMKKSKINCHFGLTVSDANFDFIKFQYKALRQDIKSITFVHDNGIYNKNNKINYRKISKGLNIIYKNYLIKSIPEIIEKVHIKISILFLNKGASSNIIPCEVMNTSAHIMPHGEIRPCMYLPILGNIKNDNIVKVYTGERAKNIRRLIKQNKCVHCWMNCYSPHSIMQHPLKSILTLLKK